MSYSCTVSFKEINAEDVYYFLVKVKREILKHIPEIAEDNYVYAPFVRYFHKPYSELDSFAEKECCCGWVRQCLTYRYFYHPTEHLLGIYGLPNCIRDMFDDTIYFQNSTDQDYPFETWDKVKPFRTTAEQYQHNSVVLYDRIRKQYDIDYEDFYDDIDYWKQTACYDEIFRTYIKDTLYDDNSAVYFSCLGYYESEVENKFLYNCERIASKKEKIE